jgi:hypothetical protein
VYKHLSILSIVGRVVPSLKQTIQGKGIGRLQIGSQVRLIEGGFDALLVLVTKGIHLVLGILRFVVAA